ncbi:MAG: cell division protein FtsA [Candidatus Omnitrophota bacterium]|jgi:cell division protein FtsA
MRYICAIDIGSSKIAACLGCFKGRELTRVWWDCTTAVGIKCGQWHDVQGLLDSLSGLLKNLKAKSGVKIKSVYLGIATQNIIAKHSQAVIALAERGNKSVSKAHIQNVIQQARILGSCLEDEIIHTEPLSYTIDNEHEVADPLGLYGHQLKVDLYLICARVTYINTIIEVVNRLGLRLNEITLSGLAVSQALFNSKEMRGVDILCDIGKDITQILIFSDGGLVHYQIITCGGDNLTSNLAEGLELPYSLAEEVKVSYGRIQHNPEVKDKEIIIKKASSYTTLSENLVMQILTQTSSEIAQAIGDAIKPHLLAISQSQALKATLYVSGRTACLDGFLELLEVVVGIPVRIAKIGNPDLSVPLMHQRILSGESTLNYLACFGLLADSIKFSYKKSSSRVGNFRSLLFSIPEKAKEIYQEYF